MKRKPQKDGAIRTKKLAVGPKVFVEFACESMEQADDLVSHVQQKYLIKKAEEN